MKKDRFLRNKDNVDFYVFLTYKLVETRTRRHFDNWFLVVPSAKLEKHMTVKDPGKREIYSFCFHFEDGKVWDERVTVPLENPLTEYSQFLDAWQLIEKRLG